MRIYIVVCYEQVGAASLRYEVCDVQEAISYGKNGKWDDYQIFEREVK